MGGAAPGEGQQLAGLRDAMREDILRQLQAAASLEALQRARQAAEAAAAARLEAELAVAHASEGERAAAAAALEARKAELAQYLGQVEAEQQQRLLLEQRIRAMESKVRVWVGGWAGGLLRWGSCCLAGWGSAARLWRALHMACMPAVSGAKPREVC